jgi:hypothetical protein
VSVLDKDFSKAKQPNFAGMSKTPADNLSVQQNVSRSDIYYRHLGRTRGHSLSNKFVAGPTGHCRKSVNLIQFFFFLLQNSVYTKWKLGSRQTQYTENIITKVAAKMATPCAFHSAHHHIPFSR